MSWLMIFILGRWSFDHFQKVFASIHRKNKKCVCVWGWGGGGGWGGRGVQKKVRGNLKDNSGRESIRFDASTTGLRATEHELVGSKKAEKLPRIPKIGTRDPGVNRTQRRCKSMTVLDS